MNDWTLIQERLPKRHNCVVGANGGNRFSLISKKVIVQDYVVRLNIEVPSVTAISCFFSFSAFCFSSIAFGVLPVCFFLNRIMNELEFNAIYSDRKVVANYQRWLDNENNSTWNYTIQMSPVNWFELLLLISLIPCKVLWHLNVWTIFSGEMTLHE